MQLFATNRIHWEEKQSQPALRIEWKMDKYVSILMLQTTDF